MSDTRLPPVRITEVGPRDGLQNEQRVVPVEAKATFVRQLIDAGHTDIEVSAFVRPDLVPQMADAAALFEALGPAPDGVTYSALVPNRHGMEQALAAGVGRVAVFTAATDAFNLRNINVTVRDAFARFKPILALRAGTDVRVRGYVSVAVACPYAGPVEPAAVVDVVKGLLDLGCDEISVGDTIGAGTPGEIRRLLDALLPHVSAERLVMHFHDTRGMAVANVLASLELGVQRFDASAGGLGGCPFAPGSAGNLATEDLVFLLDGMSLDHGIDLTRLIEASAAVVPHVGHAMPSRVHGAPPFA